MNYRRFLQNSSLLLLAATVISWASATPSSADPAKTPPVAGVTFESAASLYKSGHYGPAAAAFLQILQADPKNSTAALYLAHSYLAAGQQNQAKTYYSWISKNFPNTPNAQAAAAMEVRLGVTAPSTAKQDANSADAKRAADDGQTQAVARKKEKFDINQMIRVVRPAMNHPACTPEFIEQIKSGLENCPEHVLVYCASKGCRICLTPSLVDRNPELRNTRPRGYEEGHTYKNTPAMFDVPEVVVCQYSQMGENEDNMQPNDDSLGALRHEFGHAVDHYLHYVSRTEEYKHIYYLCRAKIENKNDLAYYIQEGTEGGGASETFAQACCIIFGGDTSAYRMRMDGQFKVAFADLIEYVKKKLNSL